MLHGLYLVLRGAKLRWHVDVVKHVLTSCLGQWLLLCTSYLFSETLRLVHLLNMFLGRVENYRRCFLPTATPVVNYELS